MREFVRLDIRLSLARKAAKEAVISRGLRYNRPLRWYLPCRG